MTKNIRTANRYKNKHVWLKNVSNIATIGLPCAAPANTTINKFYILFIDMPNMSNSYKLQNISGWRGGLSPPRYYAPE